MIRGETGKQIKIVGLPVRHECQKNCANLGIMHLSGLHEHLSRRKKRRPKIHKENACTVIKTFTLRHAGAELQQC
jgi:hypothetical protein